MNTREFIIKMGFITITIMLILTAMAFYYFNYVDSQQSINWIYGYNGT